jgi:hypothetical protein
MNITYLIPPLFESTDIIAVNKDSVYTNYRFSFGNKGLPLFEMMNFWDRQKELFNSDYYKPPQNIRETKDHLFFQFAGNMIYYFVLLDKHTNSIQSIGRTNDKLDPAIIYSDETYFYGHLSPGIIANYMQGGGDLYTTTFFKDLDVTKLDKYDNPIIIKFKLAPPS